MWTKDKIAELLKTNNLAVERAIVVLYRRQTSDEQNTSVTKYRNGHGFSAAHARIGTRWARWLISDKSHHLGGRHLVTARKIALRYVGQVTEQANLNKGRVNGE